MFPHQGQSGILGYSEKLSFEVKKLNSPRLPAIMGLSFSDFTSTRIASKHANEAEMPANGERFPMFLFGL